MKLIKDPILLQRLVEPDQSNMVYKLPGINQTLLIVEVLENSYHGWHLPEVQAQCWNLVIMKYKLASNRL